MAGPRHVWRRFNLAVRRRVISVDEKQRIEQATADGFLKLYNRNYETDFKVAELGDAPDVRCKDSKGNDLNLEITLTEDRPRDIQASLGRSNHRTLEALREHNKRVKAGLEKPQFSSLSGNVLEQVAQRINKKLLKSYGSNTALIIRDTSGVNWDWDLVIDQLKGKLELERNPFDKGIWILDLARTKLYQVVEDAV